VWFAIVFPPCFKLLASPQQCVESKHVHSYARETGKGNHLSQPWKCNPLNIFQVTGIVCITNSAVLLCYNSVERKSHLLQKKCFWTSLVTETAYRHRQILSAFQIITAQHRIPGKSHPQLLSLFTSLSYGSTRQQRSRKQHGQRSVLQQ